MNQLNSILLEGSLTADPVITDSEDSVLGSCYFPIETKRIEKNKGSRKQVISCFTVEAWGKLSDVCRERLKSGMGVRAVGRIKTKQDDDHEDLPEFYIVAEHIEIKPTVKDSSK